MCGRSAGGADPVVRRAAGVSLLKEEGLECGTWAGRSVIAKYVSRRFHKPTVQPPRPVRARCLRQRVRTTGAACCPAARPVTARLLPWRSCASAAIAVRGGG